VRLSDKVDFFGFAHISDDTEKDAGRLGAALRSLPSQSSKGLDDGGQALVGTSGWYRLCVVAGLAEEWSWCDGYAGYGAIVDGAGRCVDEDRKEREEGRHGGGGSWHGGGCG